VLQIFSLTEKIQDCK